MRKRRRMKLIIVLKNYFTLINIITMTEKEIVEITAGKIVEITAGKIVKMTEGKIVKMTAGKIVKMTVGKIMKIKVKTKIQKFYLKIMMKVLLIKFQEMIIMMILTIFGTVMEIMILLISQKKTKMKITLIFYLKMNIIRIHLNLKIIHYLGLIKMYITLIIATK